MIKKHACYLTLTLLAAPLVALADEPPVEPSNPVQVALTQLPQACPTLAGSINESSQALLEAFYQSQNYQPIWADKVRLATLQAALPTLADDGLDPQNYLLPKGQDLCADIDISRQYLQALQDLHYGRLPQAKSRGRELRPVAA